MFCYNVFILVNRNKTMVLQTSGKLCKKHCCLCAVVVTNQDAVDARDAYVCIDCECPIYNKKD